MSAKMNIAIYLECPSCGVGNYDLEFGHEEIANGAPVEFACDECSARVAVDVDVRVRVVGGENDASKFGVELADLRESVDAVRDLLSISHCVGSTAAARQSACDRRYRCWWCALTAALSREVGA